MASPSGSRPGGKIGNGTASNNTTVAQSGANIVYHYAMDPTEITGNVTVQNNFADVTGGGVFANASSQCNPCATQTGFPVNTAAPVISTNSPVEGTQLSTTNGSWTNSPNTWIYQWNTVGAAPVTLWSRRRLLEPTRAIKAISYASLSRPPVFQT